LGEVQDQARRPCGERAKVGHSLCDHRDVASNLDLHIWGVTVEACSHLGDVIGCVSHSKLLWCAFGYGALLEWRPGAASAWATARPSRASPKVKTSRLVGAGRLALIDLGYSRCARLQLFSRQIAIRQPLTVLVLQTTK
jgi:hypothetical protein